MINDIFSTNGFYKDSGGQLYFKGKLVSGITVNGGDFFGKKNMDIYQLLPALVLDKIEVVETNIDSVTNTTTLNPAIKINLKLKEKYNKGAFGNASIGYGTVNRYLSGTDLYTYKNKEQLSFGVNTNNINISDLPSSAPVITFSANGNNSTTHNARFSYRNMLSKRIEINFSAKGKIEQKSYLSEVERREESTDQFSKITNQSRIRETGVPDAKLILDYKIDSLNTLTFTQSANYDKSRQNVSSNYQISINEIAGISNLNKAQEISNSSYLSAFLYTHKFAKAGRLWHIAMNRGSASTKNKEVDSIYNLTDQHSKSYFVRGDRNSDQNTFNFNADFTEPLGTEASLNFFGKYSNDKIDYHPNIISDSLKNIQNIPITIINRYIQAGVKLQKTFNKFSFDGSLTGLTDIRNNATAGGEQHFKIFHINAELKIDYKINDKKNYVFNYRTTTIYPEAGQLINVNNSFDLISQTSANPGIKPEVKNSFTFEYNTRKTGTERMGFNASFDLYNGKFGQVINFVPNGPQNVYYSNIGQARAAGLGFSWLNNISDKIYFNYTNSISYQEQGTIINNKINLNNGVTINQTISTGKELMKNILYVSPIFTASYSKYFYESSSINVLTLTYSDKFTFTALKFQLDLYPLINYSHNINSITSFSMNGAIRRSLFKTYGTVWLQGYDLFNSFKINNNFIGSSYTETVKYSNITRYIILGISFKFNNLK